MRIARFAHTGGMSFGVVEGTPEVGGLTVAQIEGHPFGEIRFTGLFDHSARR